jgi:hypothetical protein
MSKNKIFLIIFLGLLTINAGCSEFSINPRYFYTSSGYKLHIQTNEPLSNVTFYIPLPVKNGKAVVGDIELTPGIFEKNNFSTEFVDSPPGMDLGEGYTIPDNSPVWLKIHTDTMNPDTPHHIQYNIEPTNRTSVKSPLLFSDTVHPLENQSVFLPKFHFSSPVVLSINATYPYWIEYAPIKIPHQILVYAEYSASPSAKVEIFSDIGGGNGWKEKYDETASNNYDDDFDWQHTGPSHGWQIANGEFTAANGIYPNFSDSIWQNVLTETL